jgi:hypothetical protein
MNRLLLAMGLIVVTTGCATHYYQVRGDTISLYLDKPDAKQVNFACSLDGFKPQSTAKVDGQWVMSLPSDRPFRYFYVLDGKVYLPHCQMKENDDFGSKNCIFDPQM